MSPCQPATDGNPRQVNILCERLLTQAYVEEKTGVTLSEKETQVLQQGFEKILANVLAQPRGYVHRDYQV